METRELVIKDIKYVLRKLNSRLMLKNGIDFKVFTSKEIIEADSKEKKEMVWERMPANEKKQQIEMMDKMLLLSIVEPTEVDIENIGDDVYYQLFNEVMSFCFGSKAELHSFRDEPNSATDRPVSGEVSSTAPPDIKVELG
jgi:hypothetical protein